LKRTPWILIFDHYLKKIPKGVNVKGVKVKGTISGPRNAVGLMFPKKILSLFPKEIEKNILYKK